MSEVKISAEPRTEFGKGGARRTRRAGKVPAVLYGHGEKPKHIALPAREFAAAIRNGGANQLLALDISDGTQALALPKAIQRDPIKDTFEHVDLLLVRRGEKVTVDVPVQLTGEAARDTLIVHDHDTLSVTADATKVPDHLEASIEGAEAGSQVTAADVSLPAGVELAGDPEMLVASITAAPTAEQLESTLPEVEEATEEAEAEVGEVTEGAAEAPAAEGEAGTEGRTEA
ncbi:50S ribosomal protein L25/general stress protein Ctc [Verrucosispora sp. WMMA2044]|uniref:Large ribosomal subunit protein bL25 n=1 Tax=Verrucosispora sioxanthis TaxID=2499994 RepID=A0A6M1L3A3_9ACTN|nr:MULTISPECIES: 50S ribosomal protein L25/general stress protein Ctc [Micromonospora]NEE63190.1 50S ribosomal protein L25/general stress protein Ctc [Verrucosispora sioxanthis]NGM12300.1 50S ribosomal protein L25/general stress protein Ctc [Verrucosispora sioxanthis]WBB47697.1 50S ribosomal protein L25/general stress protein Ctc [Verrucosispora sp. WMMA2044]